MPRGLQSVMCLHFSMQGEDILEQIYSSVVCVYLSQLVDQLCNLGKYLIILLNKLMSRY